MRSLISVGLVAAVLIGCAVEGPAPKSLTAVRVKAVERASGRNGNRYSANIEPASRVDLAFKVGGYVQRVAQVKGTDGKKRLVQEGDHVTAGEELAAVRVADYEQKLSEARAALSEAEAARDKAQLDFDRASKLVGSGAVARSELDAARTRLDATTAQVEGARVRASEGATALSDSHLRAPMSGVIAKRNVELGTLAQPGTVAFSIVDTSSVKVVFGVPDTELEALRLGTLQTVRTEAFQDREFEGHITRIAPVADPKSRVFEVEVSIANPEGLLRPGMVGGLDLGHGATVAAPLALVPLSAIVRAPGRPGRFALYVLDDKTTPPTVSLREVELGEFLGNSIPIRSGIAEGDRVVVQGATLVADGEKVQVIP
jgi:RND family efflux transporter MFP subunit